MKSKDPKKNSTAYRVGHLLNHTKQFRVFPAVHMDYLLSILFGMWNWCCRPAMPAHKTMDWLFFYNRIKTEQEINSRTSSCFAIRSEFTVKKMFLILMVTRVLSDSMVRASDSCTDGRGFKSYLWTLKWFSEFSSIHTYLSISFMTCSFLNYPHNSLSCDFCEIESLFTVCSFKILQTSETLISERN